VASGNGGFVIQHNDGSESEPSIGLGHRHGGDGQGTDQRFEQGLAGRAEDSAEGQDDPRQPPTPESAPRSLTGDQPNAGQGPVGGAPVAEQRGSNWALPHSSPSAIAVTRPIGLVCSPDRLTLLPDPGTYAQATVIPFGDSTESTVDQLVAAVQARMQRWGIAISGGYWKPIVKVEIIPGAEQRFQEMELLLKDSGIEFERRTL
jgi:hypothetical protein